MPRKLTCVSCGALMLSGRGSLPQGEATCHVCRRKRNRKRTLEAEQQQMMVCPECDTAFAARHPNQIYCGADCRNARRFRRGGGVSTKARGYGRAHQAVREQWRLIVERGGVDCCLCGLPIEPHEPWHLDHTPERDGYRGAAHALCNVRDGGRRGGTMTTARRRGGSDL